MSIVPASITRSVARQVLVVKKNSPTICFALGIGAVVGGAVLACRATTKLPEVLDDINDEIHDVKRVTGLDIEKNPEHMKDLGYVYGKSVGKVAVLYAPAVITGGIGIALLTGSHIQLRNRNANLMAAYATLHTAYNNYRDRTREIVGAERELDIYNNVRTEVVKNELGQKTEVKIADPNGWGPHTRFFDEGSRDFKKNAESNRFFIDCQERFANQRLKLQGHIFLNDVLEMLGFDPVPEGQVLGWILLDDGEDRDGYVSFGLEEAHNQRFMSGQERVAILNFNYDGVIFEKI